MQIFKILLINLFILFLLNDCYKGTYHIETNQLKDNKYDSEFPMKPASHKLEEITRSIQIISTLAFYKSYDFDLSSRITKRNLTDDLIKTNAITEYIFEKPTTGTATIIYHQMKKVALLTCAHIINAPDTVIFYIKDKNNKDTQYIQNISIKIRENINIIPLPATDNIEILAMDTDLDIAIIGAKLSRLPDTPTPIPVFNYPMGSAEELNWGTFVYVIGNPYGKKMIPTAIVSNPSRDKNHSFIIDATLHRGVSGGIVLAIRDGVPNFEMVGMVHALSSISHYFLRPDKNYEMPETEFLRPYEGDTFVESHLSIVYGITFALSIESICDFIEKNSTNLENKGYYLSNFIK